MTKHSQLTTHPPLDTNKTALYFRLMLVHTMTIEEVALEVKRDYEKLVETTIMRLGEEYEAERKKLKIKPERTYTRVYTVKTARKNNWIIVIGKAPSSEEYIHRGHLSYCAVTYYWDDEGLKVLRCHANDVLAIYKGHVFTRYNTRMKLGLQQPVEIIKHYFMHNRYAGYDFMILNKRSYFTGFTKDGLLLGLVFPPSYLLWRTFVSRDLLRHHQQKKEQEKVKAMDQKVLKAFVQNKEDVTSRYEKDVLNLLTGKYSVD